MTLAEAAKAKTDSEAIAASIEKVCRDNCRLVLEGRTLAAQSAVAAARMAVQGETAAAC